MFAGRVALLKEHGLIINIVDFNPSRDLMLEWVTKKFIQDLNIEVMQLKVLPKFVFLLVLRKTKDCLKILEETPLYMRSCMILVFPWEPSFDLGTSYPTNAPVWVDLMMLNPTFEEFALELLGQVGTIVYMASKHSCNMFLNVRGCVRVNLTKHLKTYVVVFVEEVGIFKTDVEF